MIKIVQLTCRCDACREMWMVAIVHKFMKPQQTRIAALLTQELPPIPDWLLNQRIANHFFRMFAAAERN